MRPPTTAVLALPPSRRVAQLAPVACVEVLRGSRDDTVVLWLSGRSAAEWRHEPWPLVWALGAVGDSEHAEAVRSALADGVGEVLRAAAGALSRMEDRLDRPLR